MFLTLNFTDINLKNKTELKKKIISSSNKPNGSSFDIVQNVLLQGISDKEINNDNNGVTVNHHPLPINHETDETNNVQPLNHDDVKAEVTVNSCNSSAKEVVDSPQVAIPTIPDAPPIEVVTVSDVIPEVAVTQVSETVAPAIIEQPETTTQSIKTEVQPPTTGQPLTIAPPIVEVTPPSDPPSAAPLTRRQRKALQNINPVGHIPFAQ